jgi:CBS domain-containing protein
MTKLVKFINKKHKPFAFKISGNVIKTTEDVSVREVAKILYNNKIGAVIVERKRNLIGIISERDIVWKAVACGKSLDKTKAKDIMTRNVVTVDFKKGVNALYETLKKFPFRHLPVTNGKKVVGMISSRDLMYLRHLKTKE